MEEAQEGGHAFDMRNRWYPVVFGSELLGPHGGPRRPYGLQLLGDPIILFRDDQGHAQCLLDKCPHRSAALSVGLVRDGLLECKAPPTHHLLFYFYFPFFGYFV